MGKEEMIKAIYNKVADKTLSFGCKILVQNNYNRNISDYIEEIVTHLLYNSIYDGYYLGLLHKGNSRYKKDTIKIIGHPVMINTCIFNIYKYNNGDIKIIQELLNMWDNKLEPIEKCGNDLCIDFIFNKLKEW